MAPGPAISGVASGNTEMSGRFIASFSSSGVVPVPPEWRANTMSIEMSSSSTPPAIRSAGMVMPKSLSSGSPNTAKNSRMPVAISVPRSAMTRRSLVVNFSVSAANTSTRSAGPMVAKKVDSARRNVSRRMTVTMAESAPLGEGAARPRAPMRCRHHPPSGGGNCRR